ncbi:MAG: SBBP repeat-containing protein [Bacteroidia bacterium]
MLKTIQLIFITLCSTISFAQQPEWLWADGGSGTSQDYATGISVDYNSNLYITGWFTSDSVTFGSTTLYNSGAIETSDIFIVKYDASGMLLWAKSFGGSGNDNSTGIKVNSEGGFFITGFYSSTSLMIDNTVLTNAGGSDVFIARFNKEGTMVWAKSAGSTADDEGNSISCDAKNYVYLTGMFESSSITFGTTVLTNTGEHDIFLTCYDPTGKVVWAKNIGGKNDDSGSILTADDSGNSYVTGKFSSPVISLGDTLLTNATSGSNGGDIFLAKYNRAGTLLWGKSLGGTYADEGYSITSDKAGNVYMTGWFKNDTVIFGCDTLMQCTILTREQGTDYGDIFIAKYDTEGNPLWAQRAGGMAKDYGFGITADPSGSIYLSGVFDSNFTSIHGVDLKNAGGSDIFIAKYNATGNLMWAKSIFGSAMSRCITSDLNGDIYIAGVYDGLQMRFGNTRLTNGGKGDVFVARLK